MTRLSKLTVTLATLGLVCAAAQVPRPEAPSNPSASSSPSANGAEREGPEGMDKAVTAAPVDPRTYSIGAEDVLLIRIWREPELSGPVAVRPDGKFSLPLVGEQQASGLTPAQVAENLTQSLLEYLRRPQVDVAIQEVRSKKYYITGEVLNPGAFPLVVPTTIMQALSQSGGFREFANRKKITILRGKERLTFNYNDYVKGKDLEQNILLEPGDEIVIP